MATTAGQFGLRASDDILRFVETLGRLEFATDVAGEQGAQSLIRILNVTRQGVRDIDRFGSAIVTLGNNLEATESQILETTSEVARAIAAFGGSAQDAAAIGATLRAIGVESEAGGTAIQRIFVDIDKAVSEGGKALNDFARITNRSAEQLRKDFGQDSVKVFISFVEGLQRIRASGGNVTKELLDLGLNSQRLLKAIQPLSLNFDKLQTAINLSNTSFRENRALVQESDQAFQSQEAALTLAGNAVDRVQRAIGEFLNPVVIASAKSFTEAADAVTNFFNSLREDDVGKLTRVRNRLQEVRQEIEENEKNLQQPFLADFQVEFAENQLKSLRTELVELQKEENDLIQITKKSETDIPNSLGKAANNSKAPLTDLQKSIMSLGATTGITLSNITDVLFPRFEIELGGKLVSLREKTTAELSALASTLSGRNLEILKAFTSSVDSETKKIARLFQQTIGGGVSQAFASFGQAIATGQNGLEALGNSVLNTLGSLAIQLGQFFILVGSGLTATSGLLGLSGGAAIAAGVALSILGGVLQGAAGGGAAGATVGPEAGTPSVGQISEVPDFEDEELREPQSIVNVTIDGVVSDPRGVAQQIAELLNDFNDSNGGVIVNTA